MKIRHTIKTFLVALALGAGPLATGFTAEEENEEKVPFAQVPPTVQRTILAQNAANSATLGEIEKDTEDGKVIYDAILILPNGKKLEVEVAEDGSLIKVESKGDEEKDGDKDKHEGKHEGKDRDNDKDDKK